MVHQAHSSVRTSVVASRFGSTSVQRWKKRNHSTSVGLLACVALIQVFLCLEPGLFTSHSFSGALKNLVKTSSPKGFSPLLSCKCCAHVEMSWPIRFTKVIKVVFCHVLWQLMLNYVWKSCFYLLGTTLILTFVHRASSEVGAIHTGHNSILFGVLRMLAVDHTACRAVLHDVRAEACMRSCTSLIHFERGMAHPLYAIQSLTSHEPCTEGTLLGCRGKTHPKSAHMLMLLW